MNTVKTIENRLELHFQNNEIVSEIRRIQGSRCNEGIWSIILSEANRDTVMQFLDKWSFKYGDSIDRIVEVSNSNFNVTIKGKKIYLSFPFNTKVIEEIKEIEGRSWNGKQWVLPLSMINYNQILSFFQKYRISKPVELFSEIEKEIKVQSINLVKSSSTISNIDVLGLKLPLRDFQKAGIEYIVNNRQVLLGDEMGLGKTVQAIASVHHLQAYPCLIVCPNSLKYNWAGEWKKWLGLDSQIIDNGTQTINKDSKIIIISYNLLSKLEDSLIKFNLKSVIGDESHYLKNKSAIRTKSFSRVAKKATELRLLLTGTPINNRPSELISQLEILDKFQSVFGGWFPFVKRYCGAYKDRFGWNTQGATNLEELHNKLRQNCYIRRNKSTVLSELPDKTRVVLDLDIDNRKEYEIAKNDIINYFKEFDFSVEQIDAATRAKHLVQFNYLKKLSIKGKLDTIISWVENFIESKEKLVLFGIHTEIIDYVANHFKCNKITGEIKAEDRQDYVNDFQNNPDTKLIVMNIQAGGVGLTLTESSNVAFMELPWTPGELLQAEDRCHRIGQKNAVTCHYLIGRDTIDIQIYELLVDKMCVTDAVNAGVFTERKESSMLNSLIKAMTKDE